MKKYFSTYREAFFLVTHPSLWFRKPLRIEDLNPDPIKQFGEWYGEVKARFSGEFPNWLVLSTVNPDGYPEGRVVLMKGFDERGIVFYTNTTSKKGRALEQVPRAAMTFYWGALQRQVRIVGDISKVSNEEADEYFASRPRGSQLGAWASTQSAELGSREELERRVAEYDEKYRGVEVPRPDFWTGFRLRPNRFEFWELRLSRLHDRFEYLRDETHSSWNIRRLYP